MRLKPYFDKKGSFHFPKNLKFGGEMKPKLKPNEWWLWVLLNSQNVPKSAFEMVGSKVTIWRIKKRLKEKGYLK